MAREKYLKVKIGAFLLIQVDINEIKMGTETEKESFCLAFVYIFIFSLHENLKMSWVRYRTV